MLKTLKNAQKVKRDRPTDKVTYRVACTRLKTVVRGRFMVGGTLVLLAFLGDLFIVCRAAVPQRECFT